MVDINPETYKLLKKLAEKENRSIRNMVETLIKKALESGKK